MMSPVMNSGDLQPARTAGYDGGSLTYQARLLDEPLFWLGHLSSCIQSEEAEELMLGADFEPALFSKLVTMPRRDEAGARARVEHVLARRKTWKNSRTAASKAMSSTTPCSASPGRTTSPEPGRPATVRRSPLT